MAGYQVGVISDTHGMLRPAALDALQGVDHILHAGDVGRVEVLEALAELAPVTAVRGNVDYGDLRYALRAIQAVELGGVWIYMLHDLGSLDLDPAAGGFGVVVSGHSHRPAIEQRNGVLYLNPGSAGPRRFTLPVSLARLEIVAGQAQARLISLDLP